MNPPVNPLDFSPGTHPDLDQLSEHLDRASDRVGTHAAQCRPCRDRLDALTRARDLMATPVPVDPARRDAHIAAALAEGPRQSTATQKTATQKTATQKSATRWSVGLGAAAAVALVGFLALGSLGRLSGSDDTSTALGAAREGAELAESADDAADRAGAPELGTAPGLTDLGLTDLGPTRDIEGVRNGLAALLVLEGTPPRFSAAEEAPCSAVVLASPGYGDGSGVVVATTDYQGEAAIAFGVVALGAGAIPPDQTSPGGGLSPIATVTVRSLDGCRELAGVAIP